MKKAGKVLIGVIAGIVLLLFLGMFAMTKMVRSSYHELDSVPVTELADVADGEYEGMAETPLVKVTVNVIVSDHKITDIQLLRHVNGKGESAESMIPEMISQNTSEVDVVTGATMSSKTIRSAVRNALVKGSSK